MSRLESGISESKVRVVLKRQFKEQPVDTMRGIISCVRDSSVEILGRHFQEVKDNMGKFIEKPLSEITRLYFVPLSSIRYIQIIEKDTEADRKDIEINKNKVLKNRQRNCVVDP